MPSFAYTARDTAGRTETGREDAESAAALATELRGRGLMVLEVKAEVEGGLGLAAVNPLMLLPVRSIDVSISLRQLAVMLRSGLTLLAALRTVAEQARRPKMSRVWGAVADAIQDGSSFADAAAKHRCFPELAVQLIRVGEQTGQLEGVLRRAAEAIDSRRKLLKSMVMALVYPAIVILMTIGVVAVLVLYLIPRLERFLRALGKRLPPMTEALLTASALSREYAVPGGIAIAFLVVALVAVYKWPPGRLVMDRLLLRLPIIGGILKLAGSTLFSRSMALLLSSGITLVEALATVERLLPNKYLAETLGKARERILRGSDLSAPLLASGAFEPMLPRMIAVGETSGTIEEVLDEVAGFHEEELESRVKNLSTIIEPVIIIVIGGIVGFVYIAVFLALFAAA